MRGTFLYTCTTRFNTKLIIKSCRTSVYKKKYPSILSLYTPIKFDNRIIWPSKTCQLFWFICFNYIFIYIKYITIIHHITQIYLNTASRNFFFEIMRQYRCFYDLLCTYVSLLFNFCKIRYGKGIRVILTIKKDLFSLSLSVMRLYLRFVETIF